MRVKAIARTESEWTRESTTSIFKVPRNYDPQLHPLAKPREFVRALNAAKVDRMMAKPFVHALSGHKDGIYAMCKHPTLLNRIYSGAVDGELRAWCLSSRATTYTVPNAHRGVVKGVVAVPSSGTLFLSCGIDKTVKLWDTERTDTPLPVRTSVGKAGFTCIDHHRTDPRFVTGGSCVQLWDHAARLPVQTFTWDNDTMTCVRCNPTEVALFAATSTDRTITLYDLRAQSPLRKLVLAMTSNAVCWNPMVPYQFAVANEDHNAYVFDMRRMDTALNVLRDHVSAVLDLDYAPTGQSLVTGAYDRTLRIFAAGAGHAHDVYHTRRMQRIWRVQFSMDAQYVLSASDDGNIRVWKAEAARKLGARQSAETLHLHQSQALLRKYAHVPMVRKVALHRPVPKPIQRAAKLKRTMLQARQQKEHNVAVHSKRNLPIVSARKKPVLGVQL